MRSNWKRGGLDEWLDGSGLGRGAMRSENESVSWVGTRTEASEVARDASHRDRQLWAHGVRQGVRAHT